MKNLRILIGVVIVLILIFANLAMYPGQPGMAGVIVDTPQPAVTINSGIPNLTPAADALQTEEVILSNEDQANGIVMGGVVLILIIAGSTIGLILHDRFNSEEK